MSDYAPDGKDGHPCIRVERFLEMQRENVALREQVQDLKELLELQDWRNRSGVLREALETIRDYGQGRGLDGCHEEALRDIARAALADQPKGETNGA